MIIKVCGMRDAENIRAVEVLDIDYMGFIFYPKSPRYVSPADMGAKEAIRACTKRKVGVFVNSTLDEILQVSDNYLLNAIQLHGDEPPSLITALKQRGFEVIRAVSVGEGATFGGFNGVELPAYFLFDTKTAGYGGSGRRFDWTALDGYNGETPFLLSGGITPDCVDAIKAVAHPKLAGIDLNSGFETAPGVKDVCLLRAFLLELEGVDFRF
ncbi:MAG: phosphoribosylanthranilate isomerase [Tannerella sp.]|jgi:phosphoribosylanthranilate isomerase|nr:phosphoribosylanthranilate isomerase [Tannerella sp.]